MRDQNGIEIAAKRLTQAIDGLKAVIERRANADRAQGEAGTKLTEQLHALGIDRSRLSAELDAAAACARRLKTANREVAQRLDVAIDTIHSVLGAGER